MRSPYFILLSTRLVLITFVALSTFLFGGCLTTPKVSTQVAHGAHLEQYKTYRIGTETVYDSNSTPPKPGNQTDVGRRLETGLGEELERHGLKSQSDNADLVFDYVAGRRQGEWADHRWTYQEGEVDISATDKTGRTVWNSHLHAIIDPKDKSHHQLREALDQAFKDYPDVNVGPPKK